MNKWHGYILVYDIPPGWLNDNKKARAWEALHEIGSQNFPQPAYNNHLRERLDKRALIIEALFSENEITREAIVATIAQAVGLSEAAVDANIDYRVFDEGLSWQESGDECRAYLKANIDEWEEETT